MDEGLLHKKLRTLEQQRAQSDDLNALLTREGGLNESQHMTCKNLKAAVAVSKQPGFFEYHKHKQSENSNNFENFHNSSKNQRLSVSRRSTSLI